MKKYVIIVAGGKGLRLGSKIPKQFLPLGEKVVLMHTLEAFYQYDEQTEIILVLPTSHQPYWKSLCADCNFGVPHQIADGGETRFHSVQNALSLVVEESLVAVHDGVRPFVSRAIIAATFDQAAQCGAVIPATDSIESLRRVVGDDSEAVDRNEYKMIQTPQVFASQLLLTAYAQPYSPFFTDDASVVEAVGATVKLITGCRENIKITTPFDLLVAHAIMNHRGIN